MDTSIDVRLSLTWQGDHWRLCTPQGNYWDLKPDLSNIKEAVAGLIKRDIARLLQTLPGDVEPIKSLGS